MNRKLKAFGLAVVASLAMSVVAASASQAAEFHSGEAHTILNAAQSTTHVFTAGEGFGGVTCSTATFAGTSTAATETEQTITPSYSGCKDSFGRTAHVAMNGCKYRFHATTETAANTFSGNTDVLCEVGKSINITITPGGFLGECKVTIPGQENTGPITFHNVANGDVRTDASASNVTNSTSGGFFNCGIANGHHTAGTYNGDAITAGTNTAGGAVNIFVG